MARIHIAPIYAWLSFDYEVTPALHLRHSLPIDFHKLWLKGGLFLTSQFAHTQDTCGAMSVLWKITSFAEERQHRMVDIDDRVCDVSPLAKGVCGFKLYAWMQAKFTTEANERAPRRFVGMTSGASCTVHARINGRQPITFKAPVDVTVDDLNFLAKSALGLNGPTSWADQLDGVTVCWATPWRASE